MNKIKLLTFVGVVIILSQTVRTEASVSLNCCINHKSLLNIGNTARLENVMQKAANGEKTVIGVIGGSITQGARASTGEKRYANLVADWWEKQFPDSEIEFINAGIGATGSEYGSYRVQDHLLKYNPDFVIVEYGVNDGNSEQAAKTLEGLIRQILKHPTQPAVMLLFMMTDVGVNAQDWHSKVGIHYELPMVSFKDALWPEIKAKRIEVADILADGVHPNDVGHSCAAAFVTHALENVLRNIGNAEDVEKLPKPLFTDSYEYTRLYRSESINPISNNGWELSKGTWQGWWWRSKLPGSIIEFEVDRGSIVSILYYRVREDMGQVKVQVDDQPAVILEGWGPQTWGGYMAFTTVAQDIPKSTHRVKIELLNTNNAESNGHEFKIMGIAVAGLND